MPQDAEGEEWHVSPQGNDSLAGTRDRPFATLERARDAARAGGRPATIVVAPGIHRRTQPLTLDARDSGLVIRGPRGTGPATAARLHAGRFIEASAFEPVHDAAILMRLDPAARGKVVALDLSTHGIEHGGPFPAVFSDGGGLVDLFVNDEPLPISRWPNDEPATMERVLDRGDCSRGPTRRGGTFLAREDRIARWRVADGIWLEGFWRVPWQPEVIRVATIDPVARAITFAEPVFGGIGSKYAPKGNLGDGKEPWWAVNLVEEIDRPAEWCVHFPTRTLFLWPPAQFASAAGGVYLADLAAPLIRVEGADDVVIEDLVIEGGLGDGVVIEGGRANRLTGCTFRNLGGTAAVIHGGEKHAVSECEIHTLGEAGLRLSGGDRATLTPCGHTATFNWIHHVGRRRKTGAAAIHVGELYHSPHGGREAVGCRVANNLLSDLPHAAVLYTGNDNIFERNEVCRVALASGDVGAFYTTHDWTSQGNVLRHNYVHDCPAANAFYLDDGDAGDTVEGNVVVDAACGAFIGGGHHNTIRNNLVVNCEIGIHIDARGVSRGYATSRRLRDGLAAVQPDAPPWSRRYPALERLAAGDPAMPSGNVITRNVTVGCGKPLRVYGPPAQFADNSIDEPVMLTPEEAGLATADPPIRLPDEAVLSAKVPGFEPIPFAAVGLAGSPRWAKTAARAAPTRIPQPHAQRFASITDVEATDIETAGDDAERETVALSLPHIFSDHMVLQREKPVPVWGTAQPETVVTVTFAGQRRQAKADTSGRWTVTLSAMPASLEPRELRAEADGADPVVVRDVLVGEVWLGAGQSNMAFPLRSNRGSQSLIAAADLPRLRVYTAAERPTDTAATPPRSNWKPCTPATAGECSAVMFFLGLRLLQELKDVPVGIVNASFGGTSIIAWIDRDTQLTSPALRAAVELDQKRHDETDLANEMVAYHVSRRFTDWQAAAAAAKAAGKKPPPQPYTPEDVYKRWVPAGTWFRLRVEPLIPHAIRGVVWYQGEADGSVAGGQRYREQLPALIAAWRRKWGDELPFVIVQLPYWKAAPTWCGVREAQLHALELPHTGMVVTYDVGDPDDVHPADKTQIGERAARWVLANIHDRSIECSGPLMTGKRFRDGAAVIDFDHADGLCGRDGRPILGFEVAGADKVWHPAEAVVREKTIVVTSAQVAAPVAVRYAWIPDPAKATLVNSTGLPASPFRSDDWPLE